MNKYVICKCFYFRKSFNKYTYHPFCVAEIVTPLKVTVVHLVEEWRGSKCVRYLLD